MSLTVAEYVAMPHDQLAALAARQANELTVTYSDKRRIARALHLRRLEVAELRTAAGLVIDGECATAIRLEAEARATS